MFKNKKDIEDWLNSMNIKNYSIDKNNVVDVYNDVILINKNLSCLPVQFGIVKGCFNCSHNKLTTLLGTPKNVYGFFDCSHNLLSSLQYMPTNVISYINCSHNKLNTLKSCNKYIYSNFNCSYNLLHDFQDFPIEVKGNLNFKNNNIPLTKIDTFYTNVKHTDIFSDFFDNSDKNYFISMIFTLKQRKYN